MRKEYSVLKYKLYGRFNYSAAISSRTYSDHVLRRVDMDEIELNSDVLYFFDPYDLSSASRFTLDDTVAKARPFAFTVIADGGLYVALAGLDFGGIEESVEWRLAYRDENDLLKLVHSDGVVGTVISSGITSMLSGRDFDTFSKEVLKARGSFHPLDGLISFDGVCTRLCSIKALKLPVFSSGSGEGNYSCYFGYDSSDVLRGVICDFEILKPSSKPGNETVSLTFDVPIEEVYIDDPKKDKNENNIARFTFVIDSGEATPSELFKACSRRGYSYHIVGEKQAALSDYLKAIEIGKAHEGETEFQLHAWSLYDNAASIYRDQSRYEEAISLYREAIGISDTFYNGAYAGLIDIYRERHDYESALAVAEDMIKARPQDPSAYMLRSEIYIALEEYEKAIADLDVLIGGFKLNEAIIDKSTCLYFLGKYTEALTTLDTYLLEARASEVYYDLRSTISLSAGDFSSAYVDAMKAIDVNPDYIVSIEKMIEYENLLFNYRGVVKWATRYIDSRPYSEYGYLMRATANSRLGEYYDAAADYVQLTRLDGKNLAYCGLLTKNALACGNSALAQKCIRELRKTDEAYYLYGVGLTFESDGRLKKAEQAFAAALKRREDEHILSELIDCLIKSGKFEQADKVMTKYADIAEDLDVFVKHAEIVASRGVTAGELAESYIERFLHGCKDTSLTDRVREFFSELVDKK